MTSKKPTKYTVNNHDILNEHFKIGVSRENEITRARKAKTFWQNAKSVSLILFFIGIAAMFIAKAIYLAKEEKVIEVIVQESTDSQDSEPQKIIMNDQEVEMITSFTKFTNLSATYKSKSYKVNTRHEYNKATDKAPYSQSCYFENSFGFTHELSAKENGKISNKPDNLTMLGAMGLSTSDLNYFRQFCKYE